MVSICYIQRRIQGVTSKMELSAKTLTFQSHELFSQKLHPRRLRILRIYHWNLIKKPQGHWCFCVFKEGSNSSSNFLLNSNIPLNMFQHCPHSFTFWKKQNENITKQLRKTKILQNISCLHCNINLTKLIH